MDSNEVAAAARELVAECQRLRDEIGRLRQILIDNDIDPDPVAPKRETSAPSNLPCVQLTTPQKIELFRSLFRGRDDVYASRWESPDGRHGYSPVAQRDWKAFEHVVIPRITDFRMRGEATDITIQDVYAALVADSARDELIMQDLICAVRQGRSPLVLTGRTEHLAHFESKLSGVVSNVFVLKGGMGRKQRKAISEALANVPDTEQRVILATGSYIGEGFDDARLDTLFLVMPISWKGTLQQYVGRLHRLHDSKRVVEVYDYVDSNVLMLARMYERRLRGYADMGYKVTSGLPEQPRLL
jgi:superfamily II DNA or RNA helicase